MLKKYPVATAIALSFCMNFGQPSLAQSTLTPTPSGDSNSLSPLPQIKEMKIIDIKVIGTTHTDAVLLSMFTKPGDEVSPSQIRDDLKRIYSLGYFLDVSATRKAVKDGFELIVYAEENPVLKKVELVNEPSLFSKAELLKIFEDQIGRTANLNEVRSAKEALESKYRTNGFSFATIRIIQDELYKGTNRLLSNDGILRLSINEGVIEDIRVEGAVETKDNVILREITLKSGDIFNSNTMRKDLARVFNTNFFEGVDIHPRPGEKNPSHIILIIDVKEKPTGSVNLGAGFNTRDGLIGTFSILKDNLMGEGRRLSVNLQFGLDIFGFFTGGATNNLPVNPNANVFSFQRTLLGRIDFFDPWMFPGRTSFGASIFSERTPLFFGQNISLGDNLQLGNGIIQTRTGFSISGGKPLFGNFVTSPWRGSLSFRAEQISVTDLNRFPRPDLSISGRPDASDHIFSVGGSLSYDTRDVIINPTKGWYGVLSAEPIWGDAAYLKFSSNLSTYYGIADWLTLAAGVRGGAFLGNNPPYEQFYSNGFNIIRGWRENGFLHGDQFVIGSLEARFPIFNPISGVIFTDIGEFFPLNQTSVLNQGLPFKYGVGLGIRLNTPMGPLRLDYGIRDIANFGFDKLFDAGQVHFSIGQKF